MALHSCLTVARSSCSSPFTKELHGFTGLYLTNQDNILLIVSTETTYSKPVRPKTSCTVILTPTVSVMCHTLI